MLVPQMDLQKRLPGRDLPRGQLQAVGSPGGLQAQQAFRIGSELVYAVVPAQRRIEPQHKRTHAFTPDSGGIIAFSKDSGGIQPNHWD